MSICYMDLADEARRLIAGGEHKEVTVRTSITKAYYALYHCALGYADSVSVPPVSDYAGPTHSKLQAFYCADPHLPRTVLMARKKIGYTLKAMHGLRCSADYDLELHMSLSDAEEQLDRANKHICCVLDLSKGSSAELA